MGLGSKISRSIKNPKKAFLRNVNRIDDFAGKKFYGNTVGLKRNLVGSMNRTKIDENLKNINPLAYELAQNQFLLMEKIYDTSLISKIKSKYDQMIESKENSVILAEHEGQVYSRHIRRPIQTLPELADLLIDDVTNIIKGYFGRNFAVKHVNCFRHYHIPKEDSSTDFISNHWHCDRRNTSEMKLFVCLSDVTPDDGPFHVQSMERTKYLMNAGFGNRDDYKIPLDVLEDPQYDKIAIGTAGSAYFANANLCFHKAGIPEPGHVRDLANFVFIPSDEPLKDDWQEHVEYTLEKYEKNL